MRVFIAISATAFLLCLGFCVVSPYSASVVFEKIAAPGYGSCGKCGRPWKFAEEHDTQFEPGRGIFPLCEPCWEALGTPEGRMPYYRQLWEKWEDSTPGHAQWKDIEKSVSAGG